MFLAFDIFEIDRIDPLLAGIEAQRILVARDGLPLAQVGGQRRKRAHGINVDPLDQGRLRRVAGRHKEPLVSPLGGHARHRQDAVDVAHAAIQAELAQNQRVVHVAKDLVGGGQDAHGDGQVVGRPLLAQVGRGEVDGEAVRRVIEPAVGKRGAHPFATLAYGNIGQADQRHLFQAAGNIHLDVNGLGIEADDGTTVHFGKHGSPHSGSNTAIFPDGSYAPDHTTRNGSCQQVAPLADLYQPPPVNVPRNS